MSGLNSRWLKEAKTDQEREFIKRSLVGSRNLLEQLEIVLKNLEDEIRSSREARPDYQDAAWAPRQAHFNGNLEMLDRIRGILPSKETLDQLFKEIKKS